MRPVLVKSLVSSECSSLCRHAEDTPPLSRWIRRSTEGGGAAMASSRARDPRCPSAPFTRDENLPDDTDAGGFEIAGAIGLLHTSPETSAIRRVRRAGDQA